MRCESDTESALLIFIVLFTLASNLAVGLLAYNYGRADGRNSIFEVLPKLCQVSK